MASAGKTDLRHPWPGAERPRALDAAGEGRRARERARIEPRSCSAGPPCDAERRVAGDDGLDEPRDDSGPRAAPTA